MMFRSLGRVVVRHRWKVLAAWVVLLVVGAIFAPRLHEVFERELVNGNTGQSQRASDVIAAEFSKRSPFQEQLVLASDRYSVEDPEYRGAAGEVFSVVKGTGLVTNITSFFSTGERTFVSADGKTTYATLDLRSRTHADGMAVAEKLLDVVRAADTPAWLTASVTGIEAVHADVIQASRESLSRAERVGLPVAMVVLIAVFGALVAAVLPLLLGFLSVVIALALAFLVGQWMDLSVFMETFASMLGLGVGIDYALFLLSRYRAERRSGRDVSAAVVEAVTHAGKAIAFSGFTVMIGLWALLATGEPTLTSVGVGGVVVVLVAVVAALTLLPAAIRLLGERLEAPRSLARLLERTRRGGLWHGWATHVMRRPVRYVLAGLLLIGALAWPTLGLERSSLGVRVLEENAQSRRGYETLAREFGTGLTSPVEIVVRSSAGVDDPEVVAGIHRLTEAVGADPHFAGATSMTSLAPDLSPEQYQALYADGFARVPEAMRGPLGNLANLDGDADTALVLGFLAPDPGSRAAWDAVRALRDDVVPSVTELRSAQVLVGGTSALEMDASDALYARFPIVIGIILAVTFLLLMVLFRSILIPLKAVVMNLLSVLASYGLLVLVFQKGYGDHLLGFTSIGSVNTGTPVLLFAVLFGLSMDYEVFLMSRIRELHDRGYSNEEAVALGLERTGSVITGAAAIMVVVFGAFLLSSILPIKEMGFALAAAVLIDATVIRVVLVPATMRLLGEWNWWLPPFLARILPRVDLEKEVTVARV